MRLLGHDIQFSLAPSFARRSDSLSSDLKDPTEWLIRSISGMAQSATGITVTPLKALGVACVYGCVRVLADTISTLPLEVRQRKGRRRTVLTDHPLTRVLGKKPNGEMTSSDWRAAVQSNLSLNSAGYSEIIRSVAGRAVGAYPIEANRMDFYREPRSKQLRYHVYDTGQKLEPQDVLHLKGVTLNGLVGLNTTACVRECIALALAMQDNAAKFFGNGSRPNGVLKHPMSLSPDAQKRLKDQFEEQAGGKNLYRLLLLEEGLEYVATRSENRDSQFIESKDAQNLEICRVFGVPPHKVGIVGSQPRANIEEENIGFVTDVIRPICFKWEQELDTKMFTLNEQNDGICAYFDLDSLLRGNRKARYDTYAIGRQWGLLTANDCREEEDLDEVEGGDVLLQPTNMVDATKATEYLMKSKTAPSQSEGGTGGKPNANT